MGANIFMLWGGSGPGGTTDISDDTNLTASDGIDLTGDLLTAVPGEIDHDALLNYVAAEHIDWSATGAEDVHADRIAAAAVTQHVGSIDHNSLLNYSANQHIDWTNSTANFSTTGTLASGAATITGLLIANATINVGVSDSVGGTINLYPNSTSTAGAINLWTSPNYDTATDRYILQAGSGSGNLRIRAVGGTSPTEDVFAIDETTHNTIIYKDLDVRGGTIQNSTGEIDTPDDWSFTGGSVGIGVSGTVKGELDLYRDGALYFHGVTPGNFFAQGNIADLWRVADQGANVVIDGDANGVRAAKYSVIVLNSAPATAGATGTAGEIRFTTNHIYLCTATNTWKRVAIATW